MVYVNKYQHMCWWESQSYVSLSLPLSVKRFGTTLTHERVVLRRKCSVHSHKYIPVHSHKCTIWDTAKKSLCNAVSSVLRVLNRWSDLFHYHLKINLAHFNWLNGLFINTGLQLYLRSCWVLIIFDKMYNNCNRIFNIFHFSLPVFEFYQHSFLTLSFGVSNVVTGQKHNTNICTRAVCGCGSITAGDADGVWGGSIWLLHFPQNSLSPIFTHPAASGANFVC